MSQPTYGPKQLRRSRTDRYIGGVCGGVAQYLNMDPTLVRILTVVITLFTGVPVVLYLVALFLMPEEDVAPARPAGQVPGSDPVWGAGGPPWAQQPTTPPAPADPPRREGDTF
ncbi:PspC domain-containing protein [Microlunatus flavus]|uniref:Phage shock protein PspC (Stress-responsive transcriptional regulator) n=1 Tax=Microlunatus flavus TaxID=1036181 RepID=A0A1H9MCS2_9ACTN|nr:PspC domain-containing protein [Microlunatus flavus]SER20933.1 Phage shock protein PspC (stress-responsive transcriptional regulator) [Microlunatus flavus]